MTENEILPFILQQRILPKIKRLNLGIF